MSTRIDMKKMLKISFVKYETSSTNFHIVEDKGEWEGFTDQYKIKPAFGLEFVDIKTSREKDLLVIEVQWSAGVWGEMSPVADHTEFEGEVALLSANIAFSQIFHAPVDDLDELKVKDYCMHNQSLLRSLAQMCSHSLLKQALANTPFSGIQIPIGIDLDLALNPKGE